MFINPFYPILLQCKIINNMEDHLKQHVEDAIEVSIAEEHEELFIDFLQ